MFTMKTLLALLFLAFTITAQAITLSWDQNIDPITGKPDLTTAGYNVFIGTAPGKEVLYKKLGLVFSYTIPQQATGAYFCYIAAYNTYGFSGLISNEVEWFVNTPTAQPNTLKVSITP